MKLIGPKKDCEYYPCHFEGQDCTWCFCPIYPCLDESKGKFKGEIWSCKDCDWIHRPEIAQEFLKPRARIFK